MADPELIAIIKRLDMALAELAEFRGELAAYLSSAPAAPDQVHLVHADDLSPEHLIDTTCAAARFGYPRDTIALWCRQGCGVKVGGRWLASVPRLQRRLNGGK